VLTPIAATTAADTLVITDDKIFDELPEEISEH